MNTRARMARFKQQYRAEPVIGRLFRFEVSVFHAFSHKLPVARLQQVFPIDSDLRRGFATFASRAGLAAHSYNKKEASDDAQISTCERRRGDRRTSGSPRWLGLCRARRGRPLPAAP